MMGQIIALYIYVHLGLNYTWMYYFIFKQNIILSNLCESEKK